MMRRGIINSGLGHSCYRFVLLMTQGVKKCFMCTEQKEFSCFKSHVYLQGQQLMDLEHKLTVAKEELEKTALDKVTRNQHWNEHHYYFPVVPICS